VDFNEARDDGLAVAPCYVDRLSSISPETLKLPLGEFPSVQNPCPKGCYTITSGGKNWGELAHL